MWVFLCIGAVQCVDVTHDVKLVEFWCFWQGSVLSLVAAVGTWLPPVLLWCVGPIRQHQILRLQQKKVQHLVAFWTRLDPRPVVDRPQYLGGRARKIWKWKATTDSFWQQLFAQRVGLPADYELLHCCCIPPRANNQRRTLLFISAAQHFLCTVNCYWHRHDDMST